MKPRKVVFDCLILKVACRPVSQGRSITVGPFQDAG
jgi:hypothetical protein